MFDFDINNLDTLEQFEIYWWETDQWCPLKTLPENLEEIQCGVLYSCPNADGTRSLWMGRGDWCSESSNTAEWGVYFNPLKPDTAVFWGSAGMNAPPANVVRPIMKAFSYNTEFLDGLEKQSREFSAITNSMTVLQYEHFPDEEAIITFIKSRINAMNKSLTYIMNSMGWPQCRAYNLHYSLKNKKRITKQYALNWLYLIGCEARITVRHVGTNVTFARPVPTDYEVTFL